MGTAVFCRCAEVCTSRRARKRFNSLRVERFQTKCGEVPLVAIFVSKSSTVLRFQSPCKGKMTYRRPSSCSFTFGVPEILAQRFLAFFEFHDDNLEFGNKTRFVAGRLHLSQRGEHRAETRSSLIISSTGDLDDQFAIERYNTFHPSHHDLAVW